MPRRVDPIGRLLLRSGGLSEAALADVLDNQRHTFPFASLCYVLGHVDEEMLVLALSKQSGFPGIVLDRSVIRLDVLDGFPRERALQHGLLPVFEDEQRVFVASEKPGAGREALRELEFARGKAVVQHIALHITLANTTRRAYRAAESRSTLYHGRDASRGQEAGDGLMYVVSDVDHMGKDAPAAQAHDALVGDVTKEILDEELFEIVETTDRGGSTLEGPTPLCDVGYPMSDSSSTTSVSGNGLSSSPSGEVINLDVGDAVTYAAARPGPGRILIVDDDFATRHLLVKTLQPHGYITTTAANGSESLRFIRADPPDLVVIDVMLPEIDGFQVCKAIKRSQRYRNIPVVLMSAVIDSGRVTDEVLKRYGADAYFEKPLNTDRIARRIEELLRASTPSAPPRQDDGFERALEMYRNGQLDGAMGLLREGLGNDPLSAKHHFVLANLLQKRSLIYEAIDEYEATVDLKPDYFPALTRLAYLYYKKGFSAKAIEMWRRSLPYCPDAALRQNIEVFMRKLIAGMQSEL